MIRHIAFYVLFVVSISLTNQQMQAQISPGDLADVHANLEGISKCTLCHVLGDKVSDEKCLDCHKEIKKQISQKKGYHVSTDVHGIECVVCHNDHHGRKFEIIRFKTENFNHQLAGYKLEGKHIDIKCNDCHKVENIKDAEIRKKKFTYLGLSTECLGCHEDYHQKTLSPDCLNCHDYKAFKPAPKFDHNKTKFKLLGKHVQVICSDCHKKEQKDGKAYQIYAGLKFDNCTACHEDIHKNKFGQNCLQCHTEQSFHAVSKGFDHDKTDFKLEGKHSAVGCKLCHKTSVSVSLNYKRCDDCHADYHEKQFVKADNSPDCAECHVINGFTESTYTTEKHTLSVFPLRGAHIKTTCVACHKKQDKLNFRQIGSKCVDCHVDYHEKQFLKDGKSPDCSECHSETSFVGSSFTVEKHTLGNFPLTGSHLATPCFACHKQQEKWKFKQIGSQCADCHENIHKEFISEKYYPVENCKVCHNDNRWNDIRFDHNQTKYILEGAHKDQSCRACHFRPLKDGEIHQQFAGLAQQCSNCHLDSHHNQFDLSGITDCKSCHNYTNWEMSNFDHNKTRFKLDGKHVNVACNDCHKEILAEGSAYRLYKIKKFACEDCHQ